MSQHTPLVNRPAAETLATVRPGQRELIALRGDESELYRRHHRTLRRIVGLRVNISSDLIEDACQQAWIKLLRFQPDRGPALLGWLTTVAIREAYRLSAKDQRHTSLDAPTTTGENAAATLADRLTSPANIDNSLEARRALRALANLSPRQRRYVTMHIAGHSYTEIAAAENVTFTNVNKHLVKARRQLRLATTQAA